MKKIKVISGIITVFLMALIFFFSAQNSGESSGVSSGVTNRIVDAVAMFFGWSDSFKDAAVEFIHGYVRKAAHFTIYAALGMSVTSAIGADGKLKIRVVFIMSLAFCAVYAATDEFHQYFVPGRAARFTDVLIDTSGAAVGSALFMLLKRLYIKINYRFDGWITLTLILMVIIFAFSSQTSNESNEVSKQVSKLIADIWNFFVRNQSYQMSASEINAHVRKLAHFSLYFILGAATAVMLAKKGRLSLHYIWLASVAVCFMYASGDEWHQSFVAGRGPLVSDVRLDTLGGMTGTAIYLLYHIIRYGFYVKSGNKGLRQPYCKTLFYRYRINRGRRERCDN